MLQSCACSGVTKSRNVVDMFVGCRCRPASDRLAMCKYLLLTNVAKTSISSV